MLEIKLNLIKDVVFNVEIILKKCFIYECTLSGGKFLIFKSKQ